MSGHGMTSIKELRERRGWSQARLAREAEMHPSTICSIERGRLRPYPGQAAKIAEALGVPVGSLAENGEDVVEAERASKTGAIERRPVRSGASGV